MYRWQQAGHAEHGNYSKPGSYQQGRQSAPAIGGPQHSRTATELAISRPAKRTDHATMAKQHTVGEAA
jgi:hypothetical protein